MLEHKIMVIWTLLILCLLFCLFQVRELVGRCTCPVQFPIIKVGEGKYKIGDSQTLVFVRVSVPFGDRVEPF